MVASLLVVAILVGAAAGYFSGSQMTSERTTTETAVDTSTVTALQGSSSDSIWNFVVSINATTVKYGQPLLLVANLTNTSPSSQTIRPYPQPFINPSVLSSNGTMVWAWDPPVATWPNWNVTSGQTLSAEVVIPTGFPQGVYQIDVAPLSSQFPNTFNLTLHFSVQITTYFSGGPNPAYPGITSASCSKSSSSCSLNITENGYSGLIGGSGSIQWDCQYYVPPGGQTCQGAFLKCESANIVSGGSAIIDCNAETSYALPAVGTPFSGVLDAGTGPGTAYEVPFTGNFSA